MKTALIPLTLALALATPLTMAEPATFTTPAASQQADTWAHGHRGLKHGHKMRMKHAMHKGDKARESFSQETVRKTADGKTTRHHVEQKVTDKGYTRQDVFTNADGKTATRQVTATYDKDKGTWSKKVEGKDFDGKTWSRSHEGKGKMNWGRGQQKSDGMGKTE